MPIYENDVKEALENWMKESDFENVEARYDTRPGPDAQGLRPESGNRLVVECKGETDGKDQWKVSWKYVSQALFDTIKKNEDPEDTDDVGIALPDTDNYRRRMDGLEGFCERQEIDVYRVADDGTVEPW